MSRLAVSMASTYALALLLASQCVPVPDPEEPKPPPAPSAEPPNDGTPCGWTCANFRRLECEEGEPTPQGAECEEWCSNAREHGYQVARDRICVNSATSCDGARACTGW